MSWTSERARIAVISRDIQRGIRPADDPALTEAYRNMRAERLADVAKIVNDQPPLSGPQIENIVALLNAGGGRDAT